MVYGVEREQATAGEDMSWVDAGHSVAAETTQALAEWMDEFFGDPTYDLEQAESLLRLKWKNRFDQEDGYDTKLRLGGKIQLPRISKRLNLVFSGEDGDDLGRIDEPGSGLTETEENQAGLVYTITDDTRDRFDLTLGVNSSGLRPGARYRLQGPLGDTFGYRYTQRLEWEWDEGFYTTGRLDLNRALSEKDLVRLANRLVYGEETDGLEWRSTLSYNHRMSHRGGRRYQINTLFASVLGSTDPSYTRNYSFGALFRRQVFRKYLFVELEPSYNFRKDSEDESRYGAWTVLLRFEIMFREDLARRAEPPEPGDPLQEPRTTGDRPAMPPP